MRGRWNTGRRRRHPSFLPPSTVWSILVCCSVPIFPHRVLRNHEQYTKLAGQQNLSSDEQLKSLAFTSASAHRRRSPDHSPLPHIFGPDRSPTRIYLSVPWITSQSRTILCKSRLIILNQQGAQILNQFLCIVCYFKVLQRERTLRIPDTSAKKTAYGR